MSETSTQQQKFTIDENRIENFEHYLFEYFYEFGLSAETIFNKDINQLGIELTEHSKLSYKTLINPELISKFPPFKKPLIDISEKVILEHIFPNGFQTVSSEKEPSLESFHFTLDNFISYEFNKKIYFTVLIFYEPYSKYLKLISRYKTTPEGKLHSNDAFKRRNSFHEQRKTKYNIPPPTLKRRKSFNKIYYNSNFDINHYQHKENPVEIYFPKAICICSLTPYPDTQLTLLKGIYEMVVNGPCDMPLEKILYNFMIDIPFLPKNQTAANLTFRQETLSIKQLSINELPSPNYKMGLIYIFPLEAIVEIYKNLLLEIPTLFFSSNKMMLTNIFESFNSFLYPFRYQYPNCAILPKINYSIIDISKTFFFGINQTYTQTFFVDNNINVYKKKIFIVDIDNKRKLCQYAYEREETPIIKLNNPEEEKKDEREINFEKTNIIDFLLPQNVKGKLLDKLKENKNKYKDNLEAFRESVNHKISSTFFNFFLLCFPEYLKYMYIKDEEIKDIIEIISNKKKCPLEKLFKVDLFLRIKSKSDQTFYLKFLNSQMFYDFLVRRYEIQTNVERLEFMFLDESIVDKNNKRIFSRSVPTLFINADNKLNKRCSKVVQIPLPTNFSAQDIKLIEKKQKSNELLEYFQQYKNNKFYYFLFPKLLYDDKFFERKLSEQEPVKNDVKETFLKDCLLAMENKHFFALYDGTNSSIPKLSQFSRSDFLYSKEMENSIAILWLRYYACTLKSCERKEQYFRFQEMLQLLSRDMKVDEYTINLIYLALYKYADRTLLINFSEAVSNLSYYKPNYTRFTYLTVKLKSNNRYKSSNITISNKKNNFVYTQFKELDDNNKMIDFTKEEILNFKKRTFGLKNTQTEMIQIDTNIQCKYCKKEFDLTRVSIVYQNMKKTDEMTSCPYCNKDIKPEVHVKLGDDGDKVFFHLRSPYYLNQFLTNNYIRKYGFDYDYTNFYQTEVSQFWGSIWFFIMKGNTYEILLKYKGQCSTPFNRAKSFIITNRVFEKKNFAIVKSCDFTLK